MIDFENMTDDFAALVARAARPIFDAFTNGAAQAERLHYEQFCEVLALPGQLLVEALRPGDVLVRRGEASLTHVAVVAAHGLWRHEQLTSLSLRPEGGRAGFYVQVVEGGAFPHTNADGFARLVLEPTGRVPHGQLLLRPRHTPAASEASSEAEATACPLPSNIFPPVLPATPLPGVPQVIPPTVPNPATPKGLVLVPHSHRRRTCQNGVFGAFAAASVMTPSAMNPGFIAADDRLLFDTKLDKKLTDLLLDTPKYAVMLSPTSRAKRAPSADDKIRVALVDLTLGKICKPGFAGWGSAFPIRGGSCVKIAMLYAAQQLIFDLNEMARVGRIRSIAGLLLAADRVWSTLKCKPDLNFLVTLDQSGPIVKVTASTDLNKHLREMIDASFSTISNSRASELMLRLGFEYIASVVWQSGLRHPTRKGLWIRNTFAGAAFKASTNKSCHTPEGNKIAWADTPFKDEKFNGLTALSAAAFFTLLAQQRFVNQTASQEMEKLLKDGCSFLPKLKDVRVRATKCGLVEAGDSAVRHDAALLQGIRHRYALAVLTTDPDWKDRKDFIRDLDKLIVANNP